jgi:hypothetical protein
LWQSSQQEALDTVVSQDLWSEPSTRRVYHSKYLKGMCMMLKFRNSNLLIWPNSWSGATYLAEALAWIGRKVEAPFLVPSCTRLKKHILKYLDMELQHAVEAMAKRCACRRWRSSGHTRQTRFSYGPSRAKDSERFESSRAGCRRGLSGSCTARPQCAVRVLVSWRRAACIFTRRFLSPLPPHFLRVPPLRVRLGHSRCARPATDPPDRAPPPPPPTRRAPSPRRAGASG